MPLPAQGGKVEDVEKFLLAGRGIVDGEPLTLQWYAVKYTEESYAKEPTFAIFDTFAAEEGRGAHLTGNVYGYRPGYEVAPLTVKFRKGCRGAGRERTEPDCRWSPNQQS